METNRNDVKNFILVLLATVTFISTYYMMMPVIPSHMLDLGYDNLTIGTVAGLFSISSMIARPISGIWIDTMGSKKVMLTSIVLFFITPLCLKIPYVLLGISLAQLMYGFTVGTFTVASATFTADIASSENLTRFMGFNSISFIIAKGLSPAFGIKLKKTFGINAAIVATVVVSLLAMALVFLLSNVKSEKNDDTDANFIKVLLHKRVYLPTLVLFCGMVTFGGISTMLPVFAEVKGIDGIEYFFLINTMVVVASRLIMGKWSNKYLEQLVGISLITLTISFISMSLVSNFTQLAMVAAIYGVGFALLFPLLTSILVLNISGLPRSIALGIFTAAFDLGVGAGVIISGFSKYIDFTWLYLSMAILPLSGFLIYQYIYLPYIRKGRVMES